MWKCIYDATDRADDGEMPPAVTVNLHTPPCQPFSAAGKREGVDDPRGQLLQLGFDYVVSQRPNVSIFECSKGVTSKAFKNVIAVQMKRLKDNNYHVRSRVLNTYDFGLAHHRKRLFMVAIASEAAVRPFTWPPKWPSATTATKSFLSAPTPADKAGRLPKHPRQKKLCIRAYKKVFQRGIDARTVPILVDIDCSLDYATYGVDCMKTLLHSRPYGPWVSTFGRRLTSDELIRCQGWLPHELPWQRAKFSQIRLGQALGNAVSLNVLQALVIEALRSIGKYPPL